MVKIDVACNRTVRYLGLKFGRPKAVKHELRFGDQVTECGVNWRTVAL